MRHLLLHLWPRSYGSERIAAMADRHDCLTQTFEVTLKWQRPDGRDDFSMYCHKRKTEYTGPGARQKQITLPIGVINLF